VSLPLVAASADHLRTAIQHLFGAELLEQAAAQQCQRHYSQGSSSTASNDTTTSEVCESSAVSIYDKEADDYTQQAVGWLVSVANLSDCNDMATKLNQVATVQAIGTVYAVRIHVDSCDATYVQYEYGHTKNATAADSGNNDIVTREGSVTATAPTPNNDRVDLRRIAQFWKRLQENFRQRREKRQQRQQQRKEQKRERKQKQHDQRQKEKQQKRERKPKQQHKHKHQKKREPKDQKQEQQKQQEDQQQEKQQQSQSRTLTNTATVLRSPSIWLAAARTLVPERDRFQCLIRTESSVQTQTPSQSH
jgi:hypothetical protein